MTCARHRLWALLILVALCPAACRRQPIAASDIRLELQASEFQVGATTLLVTVTDKDGKSIAQPGKLSIRADMSHAGMVPVVAESDQAANGVFTLPFEWTMGGGWIVEASLTLANGAVASETFEFEIDSKTGAVMADMAGQRDPPGETSAVYMRIGNRGESDRVIVSAESEAAERIEFHQTMIEDDIARMETLDFLIIPAGETLELRPGGAHIMLAGLAQDLLAQDEFLLRLKSRAGETFELEISVADMRMSDPDEAVVIGDLVFSNRWARPAQAGGLPHANMKMASEADGASG